MEVMSPEFVRLELRPVMGDNLEGEQPACVSLGWLKGQVERQAIWWWARPLLLPPVNTWVGQWMEESLCSPYFWQNWSAYGSIIHCWSFLTGLAISSLKKKQNQKYKETFYNYSNITWVLYHWLSRFLKLKSRGLFIYGLGHLRSA